MYLRRFLLKIRICRALSFKLRGRRDMRIHSVPRPPLIPDVTRLAATPAIIPVKKLNHTLVIRESPKLIIYKSPRPSLRLFPTSLASHSACANDQAIKRLFATPKIMPNMFCIISPTPYKRELARPTLAYKVWPNLCRRALRLVLHQAFVFAAVHPLENL
jgi:hypothetical protein